MKYPPAVQRLVEDTIDKGIERLEKEMEQDRTLGRIRGTPVLQEWVRGSNTLVQPDDLLDIARHVHEEIDGEARISAELFELIQHTVRVRRWLPISIKLDENGRFYIAV